MSVSIKYKGNEIASINGGGTKTLKTEGKYCEGDIEVKETATAEMSVEQGSWRSTGGSFQGYTLYARSKALTEPASLAAGAQVEMKLSGSALGNASRASVLKGRTFTSLYALPATSGTMPNNGAKTLEITDADTAVNIPEGYHNGSGSAKIADVEKAKLTEENIREGVTILGKTGTLKVANLQDEKSVSVTANGTTEITPDTGYDGMKKVALTVNVPTSGGGGGGAVSPKDINFYDYDGTCVAAWSLAELSGKTALPDYPTHEGLTCQGWNWTLADLKTENTKMNVGAMYITTDGKTKLRIVLPEQRKTLRLGLCVNGTAVIAWGDGSETASLQGTNLNTVLYTAAHSYSASGAYTISITVTGSARIPANQYVFTGAVSESGGAAAVLRSILTGVHFGSNMTCSQYSFMNLASLEYITVPSSPVGIQNMGVIQNCAKLRQITYAPGITDAGYSNAQGASIAVVCLNNGIAGLGESSLSNASNMNVTFPKSVVSTGAHLIRGDNIIKEITIPGKNGTTGNNTCYSCKALERITVGSGVTKILSNFASECQSLLTVVCLGSLESIANTAFTNANEAVSFDFTACTAVPTLENANAFNGIPADCKIRVPAALLDEWKAATNWATYADKIVGV